MGDKLNQEKDEVAKNTDAHCLSKSRPIFRPVLVKKLLEDESDDDSDEQAPNSDISEEEVDDFDGVQPLPLKSMEDVKAEPSSAVTKIDLVSREVKANECADRLVRDIELKEIRDSSIRNTEGERKSVLNSYLKDSLKIERECATNKPEDERSILNKPTDSTSLASQWQPKAKGSLEERCCAQLQEPYDLSRNPCRRQSTSDPYAQDKMPIPPKVHEDSKTAVKVSVAHSSQNTTYSILDTPLKQPPAASRPNPCNSHRSIFQTPQNKIGNEYMKNPEQTPATIFSHWSLQQHMAQTPMHNPGSSSRETVLTPATGGMAPRGSSHPSSRYYGVENKSVRRPLAEAMHAGAAHGPHLSKLQESSGESQASPPLSRENNQIQVQENSEKKPTVVYGSSHVAHEPKETNSNPVNMKLDGYVSSQAKMHMQEAKQSVPIQMDTRPKMDYHGGGMPTYSGSRSGMSAPRTVDKYDSYHSSRESQAVHGSVSSQAEQMSIQCSIAQRPSAWELRQNEIITVQKVQYAVLGILGQGMSCKVVRAQDISSSEMRAIKCVDLSKMDKDSVKGCLQEICMLDKLRAPCIVEMYHFEIKQPMLYVVMEIGDTDLSRLLRSMLAEKKRIPLTMVLYYWTEMLTAVKHIHENGVIHSDLKPANFLLVRGRLKLIDFGIASNINAEMTSVVKNCPIGTLNYISPEALMDVNAGNTDSPNHNVKYKISYKSDVWSLGCILYGLVYGMTPFHNIRQQWAKINAITDPKHKINFPLKTDSESVPAILIDVMRRCLQRNPKARPTVVELLKIPYLQGNVSHTLRPEIPAAILIKIKKQLSEEEWQKFIEILDKE